MARSIDIARPTEIPDRAGDPVDLDPSRRTDAALAARFDTFARVEAAAAGSGMAVDSPTYAILARHVAATPRLLRLARECRRGQPIPNLLFAAVKRVAADRPGCALADLYRAAGEGRVQATPLAAEFGGFCERHEQEIVQLVRQRRVQTNEVGRCSHLMPAFAVAAADAARPLALVDVGAGAGLNLLWHRYRYSYSDGTSFGPEDSPVHVNCDTRGPMPALPDRPPPVAWRAGIDLDPIDLANDDEYRWLEALVWPDHADRLARLAGARRIWLDDPPRLVAGDALERLPELLAEAPRDAAACVFHCHTLNQLSDAARAAFGDLLVAASRARPVHHVPSEGERLHVVRIDRGRRTTLLSARKSAHGRWVEWQAPERGR